MFDIVLFLIGAILAISFGFFIYRNPKETFKIQKKFYAMINWNIEPISLQKEIRNTKIMGVFLIGFALLASIYFFANTL